MRPGDLGVEGVANVAVYPEGLGLTALPDGRAGDSTLEPTGVLLKIGNFDCALMADTGPGVAEATGVLGLKGARKVEVEA